MAMASSRLSPVTSNSCAASYKPDRLTTTQSCEEARHRRAPHADKVKVMKWRYWWLIWGFAGILLISLGLGRGEWTKVKTWADALCTGCIGLTVEEDSQ